MIDARSPMCAFKGKYSSCGTYSTAFSKKPGMIVEYSAGPDDDMIGYADRVIIDYVVVSGTYG